MYRSQNVGNNTQRPFSDSDNNKRHAFSTHAGPLSSFPLVDWVAVQPQSVGGGGTHACEMDVKFEWMERQLGYTRLLLANARLDFQYSQPSS
jgi:hypothetical protein